MSDKIVIRSLEDLAKIDHGRKMSLAEYGARMNGDIKDAEIEKLRAEVERLREALREALSGLRYWVPQTARGLVERNRIMQRVEEALEGKS